MITVKEIMSESAKEKITLDIMGSLPEWFSPPEDIAAKAVRHRNMPFFAAFDGDDPAGFAAVKIHNEYTAEIYNLGVLKKYHRQGGGHLLTKACEEFCRGRDIVFLTVKTLDKSACYEPYERTRAFYKKEGFLPLEVFPDYWNEDNPCLFLVKVIGGGLNEDH